MCKIEELSWALADIAGGAGVGSTLGAEGM